MIFSVERQRALQAFQVPLTEGDTVLTTLLYIHENLDSTLAFRHGCRTGKCGLCAVEADGKTRLACQTTVVPRMVIGPLSRLPVLRDLVVDRRRFFDQLSRHQLYLAKQQFCLGSHRFYPESRQFCQDDPYSSLPQFGVIKEPAEHHNLMACTECLCCLAACPRYDWEDSSFGGPYLFVKLAQLHFDPRNTTDRRKQARELGIGECAECGKCYCPNGIAIYKTAIRPLSGHK
ncbi:MAG: 2Fe-2S iron-sulfur cluster-binding protein [Firmicutes bacterium]|nr:2Fe-2S iron-sulfur cluster-binding protein [Bacillota bacterium]